MANAKTIKYPKVPTKIKIGAQDWTVIERDRADDGYIADDSYGYTLQKTNVIILDKHCPPSRKRQTLFHELFHAIRFSNGASGIKPDMENIQADEIIATWEHYFIAMYEDTMLLVLRENPAVSDYLLSNE
jgi:Zn-dependent peptidase ImmA (M78 family)